MTPPMLSVENLFLTLETANGPREILKGITFDIAEREVVGLVGESGSGKSILAHSILNLLPPSLATYTGQISFQGKNLLALSEADMGLYRGKDIGIVFQEPMTSLNPTQTLGQQLEEPLLLHQRLSAECRRHRVDELLDLVAFPQAKQRLGAFPHELSGGQRQRLVIAMALANSPRLLIADEPTTALDVTIQAQMIELLMGLQEKLGMSLLMISHDLDIVRHMAHRVVVMEKGEVVEKNTKKDLFASPQHPYTRTLLAAEPEKSAPPVPQGAPVILSVKNLSVVVRESKGGFIKGKKYILKNVSAKLLQCET